MVGGGDSARRAHTLPKRLYRLRSLDDQVHGGQTVRPLQFLKMLQGRVCFTVALDFRGYLVPDKDINLERQNMTAAPRFFNFISMHGYERWRDGDVSLSISADRVLEYTPTDLQEKLAGLGSVALGFLKSLPTFVCSEIDETNRMLIKYGHLTRIEKYGREVSFSFTPEVDFGIVKFSSSIEAAKVFGAHSFQPYRTHWAVHLGDELNVLHSLLDIKPSVKIPPAKTFKSQVPPEISVMGVADNVESFLSFVFGATGGGGIDYFFRGHEKESYSLVPSVLREWPSGAPQYLPSEDVMGKELLIANYDEFQNDEFCFDRLVRMQHYGLPTRLLDLSSNPLIALYFACEDAKEEYGQVIVFGVRKDNIKYYDSDTVSCLANLSKLTISEKNEIDTSLPIEVFNQSYPLRQLLQYIKSEKPYFEARIKPEDVGSILCVKAKMTNSRIKSQHGAFLLFGQGSKMPADGNDLISVQRIRVTNKKEILERLDSININASTVYPSIEKSAEKIKTAHMLLNRIK